MQQFKNKFVIWEPLFIEKKSYLDKINFGWRQTIPEESKWPEALSFFCNLFAGKTIKRNNLYLNGFEKLINADTLIFKFVRGNRLLPWITNNFNFKYAPIYFVRHPFSVVASQIKHGGWNKVEKYNIPNTPYNEIYTENADFLCSLKSIEEFNTATWCIHNLETLRNSRSNKDWIVIFYENFIENPEYELNRISEKWGIKIQTNIDYSKPSKTASSEANLKSPKQQIMSWQNKFSKDQIQKMDRVLEHFNCEYYSSKSYYPLIQN